MHPYDRRIRGHATNIDRQSATWRAVETILNRRIEQLRDRLEGPVEPAATSELRGQVFEIRQLLNIVDEANRPVEEVAPTPTVPFD